MIATEGSHAWWARFVSQRSILDQGKTVTSQVLAVEVAIPHFADGAPDDIVFRPGLVMALS